MYIRTFENFKDIDSICKEYGIENYTINPDGSIDIDGNVNLSNKRLTKIPIKFGEVNGYFDCNGNKLTSLKGCPERVGYFDCSGNSLTTLEFAPKRVGGNFWCNNNDIWTFEWFETSIGGHFYCLNNPIEEIWKLFKNDEKFDLLNEIDAIRPGRIIIMDRLNEFLIMIGEEPVQNVKGYKCI